MENAKTTCKICPNFCKLAEGQIGVCKARKVENGVIKIQNYGIVTSLALDAIEKKPLFHFHKGEKILSVGSFGCNLHCDFCQNHEISMAGKNEWNHLQPISPEKLVQKAKSLLPHNNIGIAFTYNEPLVGYEFVRDCARLAKVEGLKTILVSNGYATQEVIEELLPYIDAYNIDIKCFHQAGYKKLGGDLETIKRTITKVASHAHIEVTTLVVPGLSDGENEMEQQAKWLSSIKNTIPLHINRYFPRFYKQDPPTKIETLHTLESIAKQYLKYVYMGNC